MSQLLDHFVQQNSPFHVRPQSASGAGTYCTGVCSLALLLADCNLEAATIASRRINFDEVVLTALKETEQALATYRSELDHQAALTTAQSDARRAFGLAQDQYNAGLISTLDLLTSEETLVDADAAVASSDALVVQDQIAVFKALGGGWQQPNATAPTAR